MNEFVTIVLFLTVHHSCSFATVPTIQIIQALNERYLDQHLASYFQFESINTIYVGIQTKRHANIVINIFVERTGLFGIP